MEVLAQCLDPARAARHQRGQFLRRLAAALAQLAVVQALARLDLEERGEEGVHDHAQQHRRLLRGLVDRADSLPQRRVRRALPFIDQPARGLLEARPVVHAPDIGDALAQHVVVLAGEHRIHIVAVEGRQRRTERDQPPLFTGEPFGTCSVGGAEVKLLVVHQRMAERIHHPHWNPS
ncbi:hypothetical protein ABL839_10320 [Variovorax atrisoli 110B]|nr:hypothetical protein [Variovorax paradoxus]